VRIKSSRREKSQEKSQERRRIDLGGEVCRFRDDRTIERTMDLRDEVDGDGLVLNQSCFKIFDREGGESKGFPADDSMRNG